MMTNLNGASTVDDLAPHLGVSLLATALQTLVDTLKGRTVRGELGDESGAIACLSAEEQRERGVLWSLLHARSGGGE